MDSLQKGMKKAVEKNDDLPYKRSKNISKNVKAFLILVVGQKSHIARCLQRRMPTCLLLRSTISIKLPWLLEKVSKTTTSG